MDVYFLAPSAAFLASAARAVISLARKVTSDTLYIPAACFFLMISAASSLARCCSVPESLFPDFWIFVSASFIPSESELAVVQGSASEAYMAYHSSQFLLVRLTSLVTLVATSHSCDPS